MSWVALMAARWRKQSMSWDHSSGQAMHRTFHYLWLVVAFLPKLFGCCWIPLFSPRYLDLRNWVHPMEWERVKEMATFFKAHLTLTPRSISLYYNNGIGHEAGFYMWEIIYTSRVEIAEIILSCNRGSDSIGPNGIRHRFLCNSLGEPNMDLANTQSGIQWIRWRENQSLCRRIFIVSSFDTTEASFRTKLLRWRWLPSTRQHPSEP